jgi:hypothetical protein
MSMQMTVFILFHGSVVFLCAYYHIFFLCSLVDRHLGCFHFLAIVSSATVNMGVQMSLQHTDFFPLDLYPVVGLLDPMVVLFLIF